MKFFLFVVLLASFGLFVAFNDGNPNKDKKVNEPQASQTLRVGRDAYKMKKVQLAAKELAGFAERRGYSQQLFFIIDMSLHSGKKRFFVYDAKVDSVVASGLVAHGYGNGIGNEVQFSNVDGSYCTSEGIYKIGASYQGRFGLSYKLYGLEKTNSNAFARFVVLHPYDCVPNKEIYPDFLCYSQGCPGVSPAFLRTLGKFLSNTEKPILLQILRK